MPPPPPPSTIPVLLLKTRSQPHDAYEEYFSTTPLNAAATLTTAEEGVGVGEEEWDRNGTAGRPVSFSFEPQFVPVLEHRPNRESLDVLKQALEEGSLGQKYGGMIFTSQRAVEAWAEVVKSTERQERSSQQNILGEDSSGEKQRQTQTQEDRLQDTNRSRITETRTGVELGTGIGMTLNGIEVDNTTASHTHGYERAAQRARKAEYIDDDDDNDDHNNSSFPLYSVGPATSRALNTLINESTRLTTESSPFARLRPSVVGEHTGNGANLADYILSHYNELDQRSIPTTPTMTTDPGRESPSPLPKKGLLFLVGEQRRDIIPKTLMDVDGKLDPQQRIAVDEVEVYRTGVMTSFQDDFSTRITSSRREGRHLVVVVVFSPQGCEAMLHALGFIDGANRLTESAVSRWDKNVSAVTSTSTSISTSAATDYVLDQHHSQTFVVVTIGPTTRDHLRDKFGFEADVCAAKPSPQGVGEGVEAFLRGKGLI
ncbi:hypothetical protein A1O1_03044 [Capronia coronata CBS 617.96]|uniref:Tetrapyrrole biosynthesis uroporphyrinogen III synthase domain-containing protein n=1 Tax=Capronia coronata CBS 617.96 TaxID=1182541 RepID=W9YQ09_9EURO|nr:uncharacterized protein A1O1_03044 [Capronia coronata CBS 617.96]EXJ94648.1 hypothetical protein A1O1_03044 [Capronia coronata CBS 617.96]